MVNVRKQNTNNKIRVSSSQSLGSVNTHYTTDIIAAGLAKDWAVKMDGLVDTTDYSSKYYAAQAKSHKEISESSAQIATTQANLAKQYAEEAGTIVSAKIVPATTTRLGGIKVGSNLSISEEGVLNTDADKLGVYEKSEVDSLLAQKLDSSSLPTNVSAFSNDVPYATQSDLNTLSSQVVMKTQLATVSTLGIVKPDDNSIKIDGNGTLRTAYPEITPDNINQSKGALTGNISTNNDVLNDIKSYAHSTFDLSKFTIIGSPTITSEGIASGFSSGNYIAFSTSETYDISNHTYTYKFSYIYKIISVGLPLYLINNVWVVMNGENSKLQLIGAKQGGGNQVFCESNVLTLNDGDIIDIVVTISATTQSLTYTINNGSETTKNGRGTPLLDTGTIGGRIGATYTAYLTSGSIDLKQFSITIDGVPVFNGNRTGIDTIKADNYSVLPLGTSTVTVTDDGIASGFSNSNYISADVDLSSLPSFEFIVPFKISAYSNSEVGIWGFGSGVPARLSYVYSSTRLFFYVDSANMSNSTVLDVELLTFTPTLNTEYLIKVLFTGTEYNIGYSADNGESWTFKANPVSSTATIINGGDTLRLGESFNSSPFTNGTMDLNKVHIRINGDLKYQPCLKIPYTESKTGSKVVKAVYRDRVNDMAEQFGYANYYTLSDTDFTLPMGELYGMLEHKSNIDLSNITPAQTFIDNSIAWIMPDWSKMVSKTVGIEYTADQKGWLQAFCATSQNGIALYINGYRVGYCEAQGADDSGGFACLVPVDIGDTYQLEQTGGSVYNFNFLPCKGEG